MKTNLSKAAVVFAALTMATCLLVVLVTALLLKNNEPEPEPNIPFECAVLSSTFAFENCMECIEKGGEWTYDGCSNEIILDDIIETFPPEFYEFDW